MNPFLIEIATAGLRALIMLGADRIGTAVSPDQATKWATTGALALTGFAFSVWAKYNARKKLVTALTMPAGTSEKAVEAKVKTEITPSVLTPSNTVPGVPK